MRGEGKNERCEGVEAIRNVALSEVNRCARRYLVDQSSITAVLKPVPTGQPVSGKGYGGAEKVTSAPTKPVHLPAWAAGALSQLKPPEPLVTPSLTKLPNPPLLISNTHPPTPT